MHAFFTYFFHTQTWSLLIFPYRLCSYSHTMLPSTHQRRDYTDRYFQLTLTFKRYSEEENEHLYMYIVWCFRVCECDRQAVWWECTNW